MDATEEGIGGGGEDGAALDDGVVDRVGAAIPESGEHGGLFVATGEEPREASAAVFFPFVETGRGNEAALAFIPSGAEGRLFGDGFAAGVDKGSTGRSVAIGPVRDETPMEGGGGGGADCGDAGARSDVVACLGGNAGAEGDAQAFTEVDGVAEIEREAGAHEGNYGRESGVVNHDLPWLKRW